MPVFHCTVFTARSTYVRSAVLLQECRLSVHPSFRLAACNVGGFLITYIELFGN